MKNKFRVGDYVQSNYNARWKGIVLEVTKRGRCSVTNRKLNPLVKVQVLLNSNGHPPKERTVNTYDSGCFTKINKPKEITNDPNLLP
ncbi:hypothetical protein VOWphi5012_041 [Vibrio phage phi50-12]|uniref:Uncharacterized protein n=1 Tax=Vibrio phage phi50-12 TaxID=2654972 RepID=A0A5P8PRE1_9CAUD|nr:hypothetical protein KNU82_gp041 [Vibrio phage phi50-12]QFR59825.1 hypothetical protein VOWphi5012_041 [Vibrio phage phi50-12]